MNRLIRCALLLCAAFGASSISAQTAIDEAGEPRAATSAAPAAPAPPASTARPSAARAPAPNEPSAQPLEPASAKAAVKPVSTEPRATGKTSASHVSADRVELDTTTVTGNRELPKVMYVVPWKRSDIGDLIGRPANSLLDEVLAPVDRTVFRREVQYYQALKPDTSAPQSVTGAPSAVPIAPGEK